MCSVSWNVQCTIFHKKKRSCDRFWSHFPDSNRGPTHYECVALPTEPKWHIRVCKSSHFLNAKSHLEIFFYRSRKWGRKGFCCIRNQVILFVGRLFPFVYFPVSVHPQAMIVQQEADDRNQFLFLIAAVANQFG